MRLEPPMWEALDEIRLREQRTIADILTSIRERCTDSSLTAAVRVFLLEYYRAAATDEGHRRVGQGVMREEGRSRLRKTVSPTVVKA